MTEWLRASTLVALAVFAVLCAACGGGTADTSSDDGASASAAAADAATASESETAAADVITASESETAAADVITASESETAAADVITASESETAAADVITASESETAAADAVMQTVASVEVSPGMAELTGLGASVQLTAEAFDADGHAAAGAEFSWESSDSGVATVDGSGLVTGVAEGTATVTASSGEASGSAIVAVTPTFTLSGTVSDSRRTGLVLPGAVVQLENGGRESMATGPDGRYRFPNVSGTVTVRVAAEPSYVGQAVEVTVDADRALDFALEHTGKPPFEGTAWVTPDILGPSDPTSLQSVTYAGRGMRSVWDDRPADFVMINAYLFDVKFAEQWVEFVMNPEFGSSEAARAHIDTFAPAIGRLPALLVSGLREVWINAVQYNFAANSTYGSFSLGTDEATRVAVSGGFLEEVLLHEGAHVSLEMAHQHSSGWRAAQEADGTSISNYAHAYPDSEDLAESFTLYFAVKYTPERLSAAERLAIVTAIPNRLAYFDEQGFDMSPYTARGSIDGAFTFRTTFCPSGVDDDTKSKIRGTLVGPDGQPLGGILIWAWSGDVDNSGAADTCHDGTFAISVPDGTFTLDIYAATDGSCAGWYDGGSVTNNYSEAIRIDVEGEDIDGIAIRLSALPEDTLGGVC